MLKMDQYIDPIIPRGSNEFVRYAVWTIRGFLSWATLDGILSLLCR